MHIIDYLTSIKSNNKDSGKEKATAEKIKYLRKISNINIFSLDTISKNEKYKVLKMFLLELYYLINTIFMRKNKPDLIFTRSIFCFGTHIVSKLYKVIVVREVHSDIKDESLILYRGNQLKIMLSRLLHGYILFFLRRTNGLIFNNSLLEEHYKKYYLNDSISTVSIHNGCDTDLFYPIEKNEAKEIAGLQKDALHLLFIGSVSKWHGVEDVLETHRYINKLSPAKKIKLLVVGGINQSYLTELKKYYSNDDVFFIGKVTKDKAFYYINAADICLLPVNNIRISPGSPLKLFDYAACGKPIIAQEKTTGYSDIVEKYNLGICCDFGNYRKAAAAVLTFLNNYDESFYKFNNRSVAEKYFSWEIVLAQWIDFGVSLHHKGIGYEQ